MLIHRHHMSLHTQVQLRMGDWLDEGLPMPIKDVNNNHSFLLLCWVLDIPMPVQYSADVVRHCENMLGPNGYTYYRMLLAEREPFEIPEEYKV